MRSLRRVMINTMFLLVAQTLFGQTPDIFLLRRSGGEQGIVRVNPETNAEARFADFLYVGGLNGPHGGFRLAVKPGLVVAQSRTFYEFDENSGQMLRRYIALQPSYWNWMFHGVAVDEKSARELGIESGFYGAPRCPAGGDPPGMGCTPDVPFPGYATRSNVTEYRVFLRRGLAPDDASLSLVKLFDRDAQRLPALDVAGRRFWFWLEGGPEGPQDDAIQQKLTAAPIGEHGVGDEVVLRDQRLRPGSAETFGLANAFDFDALRGRFFVPLLYPGLNYAQRLTRQDIAGVEAVIRDNADGSSLDGVAAPARRDADVYEQLIPVIGEAAGVNGTFWSTDAWFFNPSDADVEVRLTRVSNPGDEHRFVLGAKSSRAIPNLMRELGGGIAGDGSASDAVLVEAPYRSGAQLSVYTRTYTPAPGGGTYGQAVPALPTRFGYSNHLPLVDMQHDLADENPVFILDKRDPAQFRHNIGIVNTSGVAIEAELQYAFDAGRKASLVVPPHSLRQFAVEALFPSATVDSTPPVIAFAASRPAAVWMSMVDNRTGDASFIPFTSYGIDAGPSARLAFPAVAYTPGGNGTFWQTDAYALFSNRGAVGELQRPDANFYSSNAACSDRSTMRLVPTPGADVDRGAWSIGLWTTFANLARQACPDATGVTGALEVRTGSWTTAVSRTYTRRADGGTYGEILPLYPPRGWPSRHFAGIRVDDGVRVNVGLYNGSDGATRHELTLYAADGRVIARKIVDLEPRASLQRPLAELFGASFENGLYALSVQTIEGTGSWPYVSTVDNVTGDPTNWW